MQTAHFFLFFLIDFTSADCKNQSRNTANITKDRKNDDTRRFGIFPAKAKHTPPIRLASGMAGNRLSVLRRAGRLLAVTRLRRWISTFEWYLIFPYFAKTEKHRGT